MPYIDLSKGQYSFLKYLFSYTGDFISAYASLYQTQRINYYVVLVLSIFANVNKAGENPL